MSEPPDKPPLQLVDGAGHPMAESTLPGTSVWVHLGPPIRDCPAVRALLELSNLPPDDDFHVGWGERWRELPFEVETMEAEHVP